MIKNRVKPETIQKHYPYEAKRMWPNSPTNTVWWPETSNKEDSMVIGSGIPGDKDSAELCARCCNIAYHQAIKDVSNLFSSCGISVGEFISQLTGLEIPTKLYDSHDPPLTQYDNDDQDNLQLAAKSLVDKMEEIHNNDQYKLVWERDYFNSGKPYCGPNYVDELKNLKLALEKSKQ